MLPCNIQAFGYVCEFGAGPSEQGNRLVRAGYRYTYCAKPTPLWSDAQRTCRGEGGDLARIGSDDDEDFIKTTLMRGSTSNMVWLGCR